MVTQAQLCSHKYPPQVWREGHFGTWCPSSKTHKYKVSFSLVVCNWMRILAGLRVN